MPEQSSRAKWYTCEMGQEAVHMTSSGKLQGPVLNNFFEGLYE